MNIEKTTLKNNNLIVPISIIGMMFFVIGFALGINGLLMPFVKTALNISSAQSYLLLAVTKAVFVIFGYPSGLILKKIGYKKSMVFSFFFFSIGLLLFVPSAKLESFILFLVASFVMGMGNTLLQTTVNPYITIIGPKESAGKRICLMGILNKLAWAVAPIVLAIFMDLQNVQIGQIVTPFYLLAAIFVVLGVFSYFAPLPEINAEGEDVSKEENIAHESYNKTSILQFPHLLLGVLALFLYAGVEIISLSSMVDYANYLHLPHPERYTSIVVAFMIIGYLFGLIFVPKFISQVWAMRLSTGFGMIIASSLIFVSPEVSVWIVSLFGLANALVWPSIWPLALDGLGKFTKTGSSLLVTGIVGGGILLFIFGFLKDLYGMQNAYLISIPSYIYLFYYSISGYKMGRNIT